MSCCPGPLTSVRSEALLQIVEIDLAAGGQGSWRHGRLAAVHGMPQRQAGEADTAIGNGDTIRDRSADTELVDLQSPQQHCVYVDGLPWRRAHSAAC